MTRDEMIEKLEGAISNAESFERDVSIDTREARAMLAALRAPAVTGEAAQHAETLREIANGRVVKVKDMKAACLAGADALAAPPAAGAPPALVALRDALVKVRMHTSYHPPGDPELLRGLLQSIERIADAALGSPAPAPVAPPADEHVVGYTPDGTPLMRVVNVNAAGNFDVGVYAMPQLKREPAPPAVAGGDAPEIQVGDWVLTDGYPGGMHAAPIARTECDVARLARGVVNEIRGERHGQPFIWRRRQEGQ